MKNFVASNVERVTGDRETVGTQKNKGFIY